MTGPQVSVDVLILLYGFRYALGRRTGAVGDVVTTLNARWDELPEWMQKEIVRDIERAIHSNTAGAPCDVDLWSAFARKARQNSS